MYSRFPPGMLESVAEVCPAGIVIEAGTPNSMVGLLEESVAASATNMPPVGAAPLNVTVRLPLLLPLTALDGVTVMLLTVSPTGAGGTVTIAVCTSPS